MLSAKLLVSDYIKDTLFSKKLGECRKVSADVIPFRETIESVEVIIRLLIVQLVIMTHMLRLK